MKTIQLRIAPTLSSHIQKQHMEERETTGAKPVVNNYKSVFEMICIIK